jgi:hypothetical protein
VFGDGDGSASSPDAELLALGHEFDAAHIQFEDIRPEYVASMQAMAAARTDERF